MQFKNAKYINSDHNMIDCEINHPDLGWTPFTCPQEQDHGTSVDTSALFSEMVASGNVEPEYIPTAGEVAASEQATLNAASREYLDSTDWYVIRQLSRGVAIPDDISTKRAKAISAIIDVD